MKILIRYCLKIGGVFVSVFTITVFFLILLQPTLPLGLLSGPISFLWSSLSGLEQTLSGEISLKTGPWFTLSVENAQIAFNGDDDFHMLADIHSATGSIHLFSLFTGKILLDNLAVHGGTIDVAPGQKTDSPDKYEESSRYSLPFTLQQTGEIELADINLTFAYVSPKSPVIFELKRGRGTFNSGGPVFFNIEGVLNAREFSATIESKWPQKLENTPENDRPYSAQIHHKSVTTIIEGVVAGRGKGRLLVSNFSLFGEHFDDLASCIGFHGSRGQSFSLQGSGDLSKKKLHIDLHRVQLGEVSLQLSIATDTKDEQEPLYRVELNSDRLDADQLKSFFTASKITPGPQKLTEAISMEGDDKLLPSTLPAQNMLLTLDLKELIISGKTIRDIRLHSRMENGVISQTPFSAIFENATLSGQYSIDFTKKKPSITTLFDTTFINVGAILNEWQLADDIDFRLGSAKTELASSGNTLNELWENMTFSLEARDGKYVYHDANSDAALIIALHGAKIKAIPDDGITVEAHGKIADTPVDILLKMKDQRIIDSETEKNLALTMEILLAKAKITSTGTIPLPYTGAGLKLVSTCSGEQLNSLSDLFQVNLPEIGPFTLSGEIRTDPEGYRMDDFTMRVGASVLNGGLFVDTKSAPPVIKLDMHADTIQLDDFKKIWLDSPSGEEKKPGNSRYKGAWDENDLKFLTDQELLDRYNASVSVSIDEVLSGKDFLGKGVLKIEQQYGRLSIAPLSLSFPQGTARIDFSLEPTGQERHYRLNVDIDDLDYGFIGRWFKKEADISGTLRLQMFLESESSDFRNIMSDGSGYIRFFIQPEQMQTGIIDMWAVNIISYLASSLTPNGASQLNCLAGRFSLDAGVLQQDDIIIDTSGIRVKGDLTVDFHKQWIEGRLRPRPKRPQFLSLATPIQISGPLSKIDTRISSGGGIETVVRMATATIGVPIQWLVLGKLPKDGTLDCLKVMDGTELEKTAPLKEWYSSP